MPVISSRRYSSYLPPSSTATSSSGNYRANYSPCLSSTTSSAIASIISDKSTSTSRYNFSDTSSYRPSYRSSLTSGVPSTSTGSYRSRYDFDVDKHKTSTSNSTLSTRIGVSMTKRFNSDTLPPLPPSYVTNSNNAHGHTKRSVSRSRDLNESESSTKVSDRKNEVSLMNDLDFYEKYSPSRYMTKYELSRSRSLSEATQHPDRDKSPAASSNNDTSHTSRNEVC